MGGDSITMIAVLAGLLLLSAYFSATETAFSSLNKIRIKNAASNGDKRARLVLALSEDSDRVLSTILIGNNIANIASASLATIVFVRYFGDAGVTISTVVMTFLTLIFGEISPKSLAKEAPERFALAFSVLKGFMVLLQPLNFLFMLWKKLLSKLVIAKDSSGITEEELITIVEEATQDGGIDLQESELIRSAIEFNDLNVNDVLTPRVDIEAVKEDASQEEIRRLFAVSGYSRLPVYRNSTDHIIGVLHIKDFYSNLDTPLADLIKPVAFIPETLKISKLLKLLQSTKTHLAVITDEYGGTLGIVTLEDIIEELVGEIWDEHDEVIKEFEKLGENQYRIACGANLEKMFRLFGLRQKTDASTVSGWVFDELGRIPNEGDYFEYENLHVTVTKTDHRRVMEIHVQMAGPSTPEEQFTPA